MRSFTFHLQKILDLKEKEREQAQWAFGKSLRRKAEEEARLVELTRRRDELAQKLCEMQHKSCSVSQLLETSRYQQAVERAIETQQQTLYGCEQEIERCKQTLTNRMKETKLWQQMRERARERFEQMEKQREQKMLDELGVSRYILQRAANVGSTSRESGARPMSSM
ncbi:MAG: flagellar export protein FliJ [Brevibacillus sp.]|nr:flagellar export protein FliJ [Brevibacillus sp.]